MLHKMSGIEKILDKSGGEEEGGSITIFCQNFLFHSIEKPRMEPFCVSLISGV